MVMIEMSRLTAVVDTNVSLDMYGCFDLTKLYDRIGAIGVDSDKHAVFRRARARESLLLAIYLNKIKARTYSHIDEVMNILGTQVPTSDPSAFELHYTTIFIHFVKDRIFSRWREWCEPGKHAAAMKSAADTLLLNQAQANKIPLITNEGFGVDGVNDSDLKPTSLRARALAARVPVYTPREFWQKKMDEKKEIEAFLERFRTFAPRYVGSHPQPARTRESVDYVYSYYRHVLLGETNAGSVRVRVG